MGVPTSEVGYTPAMSRREDHEVHKRTCGGIGKKKVLITNTLNVFLSPVKGKEIPLQAWIGPEVSRRLRLPYLKTIGT